MNDKSIQFGLTLVQKIMYGGLVFLLSALIVLAGPTLTGVFGTVIFILAGLGLGLVTFFLSAGLTYKLELTERDIRINDRRQPTVIPLDKLGMIASSGGFPFPTIWLVIRGGGIGKEVPSKGIDPAARELIEAYQRRNPGKPVTVVQVPGGYLKSIPEFTQTLKQRIPPLTVDERLGAK